MDYTVAVSELTDRAAFRNWVSGNLEATTRALAVRPNVIRRQIFDGANPTAPNNFGALTNNPTYPNNPSIVDFLTMLESPTRDIPGTDVRYYGIKLNGYIVPTVTGNYRFRADSDDSGAFLMSFDGSTTNLVPLYFREYGCCSTVEYPNTVTLDAGKAYYFEGFMQEGNGGDYLKVEWSVAGSGAWAVIPGSELAYALDPTDVGFTTPLAQLTTVQDGDSATLSVAVTSEGKPYAFQWQRWDGVAFTNIVGATSTTYITPGLGWADQGAIYRCEATFAGIVTKSTQTAVALVPNTTPLTLTAFTNSTDLMTLTLNFNKRVSAATAANTANYEVTGSGSVSILLATLSADGKTITLLTTPQSSGSPYHMIVRDLVDNSTNANSLNPNPLMLMFDTLAVANPGVAGNARVWLDRYDNIGGGTAVADLTSNPVYPNSPSVVLGLTDMYYGPNLDNYGARMRAFFVAPNSANYTFWTMSDDGSEVYISTNGIPANKFLGAFSLPAGTVYVTSTNLSFSLEAGQVVYIEGLVKEGGGGDYLDIGFSTNGSAPTRITGANLLPLVNPVGAGGSVSITESPTNVTVSAGQTATFHVTAETFSGIVGYQWKVNGTNIAGANKASLVTGTLFPSANGSVYSCQVVDALGAVAASGSATLTVLTETVAPQLVAVGSLDGLSIGVRLSESVDPSTVTNLANYTVDGGMIAVTSVQLRADGSSLRLFVQQPITNGTFTVAIQNVMDYSGNVIGTTPVVGRMLGFSSMDVGATGNPSPAGDVFTTSQDLTTVTVGGTDIWDSADGFNFIYRHVAGDFDVRVRVGRLDYIGSPWSKSGLMVREFLTPGSRNMSAVVTPNNPGVDTFEPNWRETADGATGSWPGYGNVTGVAPNVTYPNAWIRLTRAGNTFTAYRSTNGTDWVVFGINTPAVVYPETVLLGMATTSHQQGTATVAEFREIIGFGLHAAPTIVQQPYAALLTPGGHTVLGITVDSPVSVTYQWRLNGTNIAGATTSALDIPMFGVDQQGSYDCVVTGDRSITSEALVLTLPTVVPPQLPVATLVGGNIEFTIQTLVGRMYSIEYTESITPPDWKLLGAPVLGTGTNVISDVAPTNQHKFYRMLVR
jgi:hypothetical protein